MSSNILKLFTEVVGDETLDRISNEVTPEQDDEKITDGELIDLLYVELDKEQSTEDLGRVLAEILREHR